MDRFLCVLPAVSGCDRLGADVSAFVLAAATADGRAAAKYLAHHSTRSSYAGVVASGRNASDLVLVRRYARSGRSLDDFSKSACSGSADSGRVVNYHRGVHYRRSCLSDGFNTIALTFATRLASELYARSL